MITVVDAPRRDGADPDTTVMIAETDSPVRCAKGMVVLPHHSIDDHPPLDVIVVPSGQGTRAEIDNETLLAWLGNTSHWRRGSPAEAVLQARCWIGAGLALLNG